MTSRKTHLREAFTAVLIREAGILLLARAGAGGALVVPSDEIREFGDNSFIPRRSVHYLAIIGLETHEYCPRLRLGTIYVMCPRPIITNNGHSSGV